MSLDPQYWPELNREVRYAISEAETDRTWFESRIERAIEVRLWEKLGHPHFDAWVAAGFEDDPPGLGLEPRKLLAIASALSPALADRIDVARVRGPGGKNNPHGRKGKPRTNVDNIHDDSGLKRPSGTSKAAALRRLRTDADAAVDAETREKARELHRQVIEGALSAHAAAVEMGYRKRLESRDIIRREWAKLTLDEQRGLLTELCEAMDARALEEVDSG